MKCTKTVPLWYYCYKRYPFLRGTLFALIIMFMVKRVPLSKRVPFSRRAALWGTVLRKKGWKQCLFPTFFV